MKKITHLRFYRLFLFSLIIASLTACASTPGVTTAAFNNRQVEYVLLGQGKPAVVFENGLGGQLHWWSQVLPAVALQTTAFAYNRPGTGNSQEVITSRTGDQIIEELRSQLLALHLQPPYVLVGHSLGGLYMQLYARRYPQEVAGLILVDSTHPEQFKGAGAPENWPKVVQVMLNASINSSAQKEFNEINSTGQAMLALPPFKSSNTIVLSAKKPMSETSVLAQDSNQKRVDILRLHPGAKQVWVESGHAIPLEKPAAIINAISEILNATK